MAIRLKLPGGVEIETDSSDEAVEVYQQLRASLSGNLMAEDDEVDHANQDANDDDEGNNADAREVSLGANAKAMLKILMGTTAGTGRSTSFIAENIGVNGPKGLAGVTRQIKAWGKQTFGLDADDCIYRFRSQQGNNCLKIADELRAKIKGHEVELLE
jgi:hypothetical protein